MLYSSPKTKKQMRINTSLLTRTYVRQIEWINYIVIRCFERGKRTNRTSSIYTLTTKLNPQILKHSSQYTEIRVYTSGDHIVYYIFTLYITSCNKIKKCEKQRKKSSRIKCISSWTRPVWVLLISPAKPSSMQSKLLSSKHAPFSNCYFQYTDCRHHYCPEAVTLNSLIKKPNTIRFILQITHGFSKFLYHN